MIIRLRRKLLFALGLASVFELSLPVWAQSGTKSPAGATKTVVQGSGSVKKEAAVALS